MIAGVLKLVPERHCHEGFVLDDHERLARLNGVRGVHRHSTFLKQCARDLGCRPLKYELGRCGDIITYEGDLGVFDADLRAWSCGKRAPAWRCSASSVAYRLGQNLEPVFLDD